MFLHIVHITKKYHLMRKKRSGISNIAIISPKHTRTPDTAETCVPLEWTFPMKLCCISC